MFPVQRFPVPKKRRKRNRYPLHLLREIGQGFIVKKARLPKGQLHGIGRHLGYKLSVTTLKNGDKQVVRVG